MERSELAALYAQAEANLQRAQSQRCRVELAKARRQLEQLEAAVLAALTAGPDPISWTLLMSTTMTADML